MTRKDIIKCIAILAAICIVVSGALAVVNHFTAPVIDAAAMERENASRQVLLPDAANFEPLDTAAMPDSITAAYRGLDAAGGIVGYVFTAGSRGFDGTIVVMTAIGNDGTILRVATIDVTSETKTLGGLTAEASYTEQYIGQGPDLAEVDAISHATITSEAYEACVRDSFAAYDCVKEG